MGKGHSPARPKKKDIADSVHRYFATGLGLITTDGKRGPNVMAAEWTMQVSYDPMLIAIFIHESPTLENIKEAKVFGVNMASDSQAELVNVAGGYSAHEINKMGIGSLFDQYRGKQIDAPMIRGCVLNAECRVVSMQEVGDHVMVVGEAVAASFDEKKSPLIYHRGNYRKITARKIPAGRKVVYTDKFYELKQMARGQFVLKAACAIVRDGAKTLVIGEEKLGNLETFPIATVERGSSYVEALRQYLESLGIMAEIKGISSIARFLVRNSKDKKSEIRVNFVLFDCAFVSAAPSAKFEWKKKKKGFSFPR